jgi:hypothetical protein
MGASPEMDSFHRRVDRVTSGASARHVIWVGADECHAIPPKVHVVRKSALTRLASNAGYPISLVMAVALGFFGHGLDLVVRYHLNGLPDAKANPDIEMLSQVVIGFALAMVAGYALRLRSSELTTLKLLGAVLGVLMFHNLVHLWPEVFATICSKVWVNDVVSHTKAWSLVWRGISFTF